MNITNSTFNITRPLSFVEYLGDNISINNLDNDTKSQIAVIFTVASDGDHYLSWQPNSIYNSLTNLETNKNYIVISNQECPAFAIANIIAEPLAPSSIILDKKISLVTFKDIVSLPITSISFPHIEKMDLLISHGAKMLLIHLIH
jgi:hypothetical protein